MTAGYAQLLEDALHWTAPAYRNIVWLQTGRAGSRPGHHLAYLDIEDDDEPLLRDVLTEQATLVDPLYDQVVMYPFDMSKIHQPTRYSNGRFGAWYGADNPDSTIHEVGFHKKAEWRQQAQAGLFEHTQELTQRRRIFKVPIDSVLIDLRAKVRGNPWLVDQSTEYRRTQALGAHCAARHPGLVSLSARHRPGDTLALFRRDGIGTPRLYAEYKFSYRPHQDRLVAIGDSIGAIAL